MANTPKQDITTDNLLVWDKYKDKPFDQALPSIYQHAETRYKLISGWYWRSIRVHRLGAPLSRWLTFALLALGTVLPIWAGMLSTAESKLMLTQSGVIALVLGGLIQVGDRVFGWTSGWFRYISTVTTIENLARTFELAWAGYVLDKSGNLDVGDVKPLFDLAKQFEEDMLKLQCDETNKWITEFQNGSALLSDLIKSQREAADKATEAARLTVTEQQNNRLGAIQLSLSYSAGVITVEIVLDAEAPGEKFTGTAWAKTQVPPGHHVLTITTTGDTPNTIQRVVDVPAGGIASLSIEL